MSGSYRRRLREAPVAPVAGLVRALALAAHVAMAAAVTGCATISVSSDYDPAADFTVFQTYDWLPRDRDLEADPPIEQTLLTQRVRAAVDRELAAKGFARIYDGTPDFFVTYHAAVNRRLDVRSIDSAVGYSEARWGWSTGAGADVREYEEGSLLLDVVDAESMELRWRGSATAEIHESDKPEKRIARIDESVRRMLERFPPTTRR